MPDARSGRAVGAILITLAAAPLLSACVAAAALPVIAAGGLVRSKTNHGATVPQRPETTPRDFDATTTQSAAPATGGLVGATSDEGPPPSAAKTKLNEYAVYRVTELTKLPPPLSAVPASAGVAADRDYDTFVAFAAAQAAQPVVGSERRSAVLADATTMKPETRMCSIHPASVLIDLDPADSTFDLAASRPTQPNLVRQLAALRDDGVIIGWVSNRTADQAGMVRRALRQSGLDPDGKDELVLLRFPEERKQTRRDDFAKSHCVVAIAGDQKSDFDELFSYLRDPALALPLDKMLGAGWFIAPPPLATN